MLRTDYVLRAVGLVHGAPRRPRAGVLHCPRPRVHQGVPTARTEILMHIRRCHARCNYRQMHRDRTVEFHRKTYCTTVQRAVSTSMMAGRSGRHQLEMLGRSIPGVVTHSTDAERC